MRRIVTKRRKGGRERGREGGREGLPPAVQEPITTAIWGMPAADMLAWL